MVFSPLESQWSRLNPKKHVEAASAAQSKALDKNVFLPFRILANTGYKRNSNKNHQIIDNGTCDIFHSFD